jgi:hypothetical protein
MFRWWREYRARLEAARRCREGIERCAWCQDKLDRGLNPYTGEPL